MAWCHAAHFTRSSLPGSVQGCFQRHKACPGWQAAWCWSTNHLQPSWPAMFVTTHHIAAGGGRSCSSVSVCSCAGSCACSTGRQRGVHDCRGGPREVGTLQLCQLLCAWIPVVYWPSYQAFLFHLRSLRGVHQCTQASLPCLAGGAIHCAGWLGCDLCRLHILSVLGRVGPQWPVNSLQGRSQTS